MLYFISSSASLTSWLTNSIDVEMPEMDRANPKSQSFIVQSSLTNMLPGFISLCKILAECIYFKLHSKLYMIVFICISSRFSDDFKSFFTSESANSKTIFSLLKVFLFLGGIMSYSLTA